jgi:hypothetical protein
MKNLIDSSRDRLILLAIVLFAFAGGIMLRPSNSVAAAGGGSVGRYLLMRESDTVMFCIDSQTGDVWRKLNASTNWDADGNPPQGTPGIAK